jgi:4-diphosphocytidyl-2-C-methyl-D-erythritol kinase
MSQRLIIRAPAKINLGLNVLRRRPDGYHDLETVMQQISLGDTLLIESLTQANGWVFSCTDPELDSADNLVCRAASLFRSLTKKSLPGVKITLYKNIPTQAGLGGGSSDAAAALMGLNKLWQLSLKKSDLLQLAARLGSDVPFCLRGGTAIARGRGEILQQLPPLPFFWVVLALPPAMSISTAEAYGLIDSGSLGEPSVDELIEAINKGNKAKVIAWLAAGQTNTFEEIIIKHYSSLSNFKSAFHILSLRPSLSGSGPAFFMLTEDYSTARSLAYAIRDNGGRAYLSWTEVGNEEWLYV